MPRIAIDRIEPDSEQPRKTFLASEINELAASILEHGLIQPVTVRAHEKRKGVFRMCYGERRLRAHHVLVNAGHKRFAFIDATVRQPKNEIDLRVKQIVENTQRADMPLLEEAAGYANLAAMGLSEEEIARQCGVDESRIRSRLALLNLAPELIHLFKRGQLEKQHALELSRLPRHEDQKRLLQMINRGEIAPAWHSVRKAVDVIVNKVTQTDMFGGEAAATTQEVAAVNAMEERIERAARLMSSGWRDGECVVAAKVSRDRAAHMADKLAAMRDCVRRMENELRHVTAQARIVLFDGADHA